ncbi:hypothetical protein KCU93_g198, partial [Aureobasidium melanogenum]
MYSVSKEPNHNLLVSSVVLIIVGSFLSVRGQCSNSGGLRGLTGSASLPPWKEFLPLLLFLPLPFLGLLALSLAPPVLLTGVLGLDSALPSDDAGTTSDDRELTMPVIPASLVPRERVHARQHDSSHHALLFLLTTTPLLLTASFFVQSQFTFAEHLLAEACWDARLIAWRQGLWSQVTPVMVTKVGRQVKSESIERWLSYIVKVDWAYWDVPCWGCSYVVSYDHSIEVPMAPTVLNHHCSVWRWRALSFAVVAVMLSPSVSSSILIGVGLGKIVEARSSGSDKTDLEAVEKSRLIVVVLLADSLSVGQGSSAEISSLLSYRTVCGRLPLKRGLCGKKQWTVREDECQG